MAPQPFAMIHTEDQWRRAAHANTALAVENGAVQLAWELEYPPPAADPQLPPQGAPMVFDPWCRLYRALPERGQVRSFLWNGRGPGEGRVLDLFRDEPRQAGDFRMVGDRQESLAIPDGLAVDDLGHLFVAEAGRDRVLVIDLVDRRLLRQVPLVRAPVDLAGDGRQVYALLAGPPALAVFDAHQPARLEPLPDTIAAPSRLALADDGRLFVLDAAGTPGARIVPRELPDQWIAVPHASDMVFESADVLVVARAPGQTFRRFRIAAGAQWELPYLAARHYDGRGIVRTPAGRIGFWGANGFAHATLARPRYTPQGRVTTYRLDSGRYQTVWGRIFVDACIPKGTRLQVLCLTADDPPEGVDLLPRTAPANTLAVTIHRPDLSPPMPPATLAEQAAAQRLHRRDGGRELAWLCGPREDGFETYEAPVMAPRGRYLWLALDLHGSTGLTPKIKSVRVEYPGHTLLQRLPRVYSRDGAVADFLQRYLAILDGSLREVDLRAMLRHVLLDPHAAPGQVLPWLAGFLGLVLDERWPEATRREVIARGIWLLRYRGTVMGLKTFIEIYLGRPVEFIEHFKVRGLGGAIVGESEDPASRAVVGAGFRVGGQLGGADLAPIGTPATTRDAFETHAHRFSVVIPASLTREQQEVIAHILELHRPCHTVSDLCSVDAGMKVGVSLYVQLTTIVGRTSGFGQTQVGGSLLGRTDVLGRPGTGTRIGGSRLGTDSRMG